MHQCAAPTISGRVRIILFSKSQAGLRPLDMRKINPHRPVRKSISNYFLKFLKYMKHTYGQTVSDIYNPSACAYHTRKTLSSRLVTFFQIFFGGSREVDTYTRMRTRVDVDSCACVRESMSIRVRVCDSRCRLVYACAKVDVDKSAQHDAHE